MSGSITNNDTKKEIVIVGAGVIGLTTARILQSSHPGTKITIVANEFPRLPSTWTLDSRPSADYASMWAGAHYRPIPRSTRQLDQEYGWAVRTNTVMLGVAKEFDVMECGVGVVPGVELLECPGDVERALRNGEIYAGEGDGFRTLSEDELRKYDGVTGDKGGQEKSGPEPESRSKWGCEYMTYVINVHVYCDWLLKRFVEAGGKVLQRKLERLEDVFDVGVDAVSSRDMTTTTTTPLVVNCSGRNFDTDPATKIIRGQTVTVQNQYHRTITRQNSDGSWAFLIPRPGGAGTVVGGTKEIDDMNTEPILETRIKLLENAVRYFPDFVDNVDKFEVLTDNVGRRPWREGGLRIEVERLSPDRTIVHGYGAGGRGYELSVGVAEEIAALVDKELLSASSQI